ncbi:cupin domain-containing protein [Granulicella sibirica]|uniref:Pectin degradation protein KdgF n=1 Tax=Granulicella sibirica TaxID=2479048 RepID=A0A4Q0T508_9BACT|nr:cupin domain-containing protein [Granulicella sibirica]RXH56641.1 Pectin degradation protein KdgF [Granulicella sibirica]
MKLYDWTQVEEEQVNPLATRQMIHSDTMTVIRRRLLKGSVSGLHRHLDEQISMIEHGSILFLVEDSPQAVHAGQTFIIPSNALHSVEALEDSIVLDLFAAPQPVTTSPAKV